MNLKIAALLGIVFGVGICWLGYRLLQTYGGLSW